jgi:hypothetical protein
LRFVCLHFRRTEQNEFPGPSLWKVVALGWLYTLSPPKEVCGLVKLVLPAAGFIFVWVKFYLTFGLLLVVNNIKVLILLHRLNLLALKTEHLCCAREIA